MLKIRLEGPNHVSLILPHSIRDCACFCDSLNVDIKVFNKIRLEGPNRAFTILLLHLDLI